MSVERVCLFHWLRISQSLADSNFSYVQDVSDHAEYIVSVKRAVQLNPVLTADERAILGRSYESAAESRAASIRSVSSLIASGGSRSHLAGLCTFHTKMTEEFTEVCLDLIHLADSLPGPGFFPAKLKADFYRRLCVSISLSGYLGSAKESYQEAKEIGQAELGAASPDYLALVIDFCTFLREVAVMPAEATAVAAAAREAAVGASDDGESIELLRALHEISLLDGDAPI
jgi:hypothetical protein